MKPFLIWLTLVCGVTYWIGGPWAAAIAALLVTLIARLGSGILAGEILREMLEAENERLRSARALDADTIEALQDENDELRDAVDW